MNKTKIFTLKIHSTSRMSLDFELHRQFKKLNPGVVLDVGSNDSPYKKNIPYTEYLRLDINKESNPDILCDLHHIKWESDYFDTVIATEVLEHLHDPQIAIDEIHRVLKPGGVCILSTRFIHQYHPSPKDYYRFTKDSLEYLFRNFNKTKIYPHGNRIQVIWQLINAGKIKIILNLFNFLFAKINIKDNKFPCGFIVYSVKV